MVCMKLLVFDTETTGLPPKALLNMDTLSLFPHVLQFSWMMYNTDTGEYTENDYIIDCKHPFNNSHIHGITPEIVNEKGVSFTSVFTIFMSCMKTCDLLVAHNLSFDISMLEAECMRNSLQWIILKPSYCTMKSTTKMCGLGPTGYKWPKLSELHTHLFNENVENLHNALVDVIVCLRCFMKIMMNVDICVKDTTFQKWFTKELLV